MSITHGALLALLVSAAGAWNAPSLAQVAGPALVPVTVVGSVDPRLHTRAAGLRIVVRDVDAPDRPIDLANITVDGIDSTGRYLKWGARTDDRGVATVMHAGSGDYTVLVMRVGYNHARLTVYLRPNCASILEVYVAKDNMQLDRCQVTVVGRPPCDPDPPTTQSRAVLTTCAQTG